MDTMKTIDREMLSSFGAKLKNDERSDLTVEKYLRDVRRFIAFARGGAVDREKVLVYKAALGKEYAVSSANSMLAALNAFFRFIGWPELCVKQFRVQRKTFCGEEKELTRAEYVRLCRAAEERGDERLSLILQTICGTGIRVSELAFVTVEAARTGEATVDCKNKARRIFIVPALRKKLLSYCRRRGIREGHVFRSKTGRPVSRVAVWRAMKCLCEAARVAPGKVFPHNLRHLFARAFYAVEKDIAKLADVLGHSSVDTTRIYIITTGREHRRKMEMLHLIL